MIEARFGHVNLIAHDWRRLADFYERVFGCTPVPPERNLGGPEFAAATGVLGAAVRGMHLQLPGGPADGPTLEIFQYEPSLEHPGTAANRPGFGHLAFQVLDVAAAREAVLQEGGSPVGTVITTQTRDGRSVTWAYVTDPEGNILELQHWSG